MISTIKLQNFGPFSDVEFDLERRKGEPNAFAMVYGENGAGKTRLIDSIEFLKETAHTYLGPQRAEALSAEKMNTEIPTDASKRKEVDKALLSLIDALSKDLSLSLKEASIQKTVRGRIMPGSDGMSTSYEFLLDGRRFTYSMEFGGDGKLIGESMRAPITSRICDIYAIKSSENGLDIQISPSLLKDDGYRDEMIETIKRYWGNNTFLSIMNDQYIIKNETFMAQNVLDSFDRIRRYIDSIVVVFSSKDTIRIDGFDYCQGIAEISDTKRLDDAESAYDAFFKSIDGNIKHVHYRREAIDSGITYSLVFDRRISGRIVSINYEDESNGIKKLARMLPAIALTSGGRTILIDEMDSNIHDLMIAELMERIRGYLEGQLIITSHNTELLDDSEPSSIYIIQVDRKGFRKILPMNKIARAQKTNSIRRLYLRGCYEGVPYVGDVDLENVLSKFTGTRKR